MFKFPLFRNHIIKETNCTSVLFRRHFAKVHALFTPNQPMCCFRTRHRRSCVDARNPDDPLFQILMGDMTQLSVWDRALTAAEVGRIANCQEIGRGNILSSDITELEVVGSVEQQWEKIGTFCR